MGSKESPLRVLVIGAGSSGLLTAQVLKQVGISCTVYEQDKSLSQRPRDWNFGIYWAQSRLDECLTPDLKELLASVQTDPKYVISAESVMPVYNGETGQLLKELPAPWSMRLARKKWLQMLSKGVDIKWEKRLKLIETAGQEVIATFEDGTQETGNLLIGTEGAHSPTRDFLLGPKEAALLPSLIVASVTITKLTREASIALRKLHPRYTISFHPNGTFTWQSIHDCSSEDPAEWTWMIMQTWKSEKPTSLTTQKEIHADWYERGKTFGLPFKAMFLDTPKDTTVWHNRLSYWPTRHWDSRNGLVTLAGDAAHPMTFHRGQGLNNAITDAAELFTQLRKMEGHTPQELSAAVARYESDLWPRGNEAVLASLQNTNAVHHWSTMMLSPLFTGGLAKDITRDATEDAGKVVVKEDRVRTGEDDGEEVTK